jgi:hypothetical protein
MLAENVRVWIIACFQIGAAFAGIHKTRNRARDLRQTLPSKLLITERMRYHSTAVMQDKAILLSQNSAEYSPTSREIWKMEKFRGLSKKIKNFFFHITVFYIGGSIVFTIGREDQVREGWKGKCSLTRGCRSEIRCPACRLYKRFSFEPVLIPLLFRRGACTLKEYRLVDLPWCELWGRWAALHC